MDDFEGLTDVQSEILKQFQEVTNVQDAQMAIATLASLNWDIQKAIETQISNDNSTVDMEVETSDYSPFHSSFPAPSSEPNGSNSYVDNLFTTDDSSDCDDYLRSAAGGSAKSFNGEIRSNGILGNSSSGSNLSKRHTSATKTTSSSTTSTTRNSRSNTARNSRTTASAVTTESDSDEDISHDHDPFGHDDDILDSVPSRQDDRVPLVPAEFSTIEEAMNNFVTVFEARYGGSHPTFFMNHLHEAVREAFEAPDRSIQERRPLAVYLHNDNAVACNIFAKNVMCSDVVSSLLKGQFVTWPWDMTQRENRLKLFEWMEGLNVRDLKNTLERLSDERYPLLVVLIKDKGVIQPVEVAWGCDDPQQVVDKLMNGLDQYQNIKNTDAAEERERIEREEILREQAREYERSLAQDRARQKQLETERKQQEKEEELRQLAEENKVKRESELAASLPPEPSASEKGVMTVRVRFPNGQTEMRRFRPSEPLQLLVTFIESKGYSTQNHRIWTSDVPKKNVVESFDLSRSLSDLKWPIREQVTVDEK